MNEQLANVTLTFSVPVYLPFLLVGSVFVTFVVGGACVGICCCKCLKSQDEGQQSGLVPGQTWLLEPDLPSRLSSSSSATRNSLSSGPQTSNICVTLAPSLPIIELADDARFLGPPPTSRQLFHPSHTNHRIPTDHTVIMAPASFFKRTIYGHSANASALGVTQGDQMLYSGAHVWGGDTSAYSLTLSEEVLQDWNGDFQVFDAIRNCINFGFYSSEGDVLELLFF